MPLPALNKLYNILENYFLKTRDNITVEDLRNASNLKHHVSKIVVLQFNDINKFILMWRNHFIENANPKFLPYGWKHEKCKVLSR